jgi:hypothetical protein
LISKSISLLYTFNLEKVNLHPQTTYPFDTLES